VGKYYGYSAFQRTVSFYRIEEETVGEQGKNLVAN
jgi:hypothetical protein